MLYRTTGNAHLRAAVSAALAVLAPSVQTMADPLLTIDLRVHGTGGKTATVSNVGDLVTMDVFATIPNNDGNSGNETFSGTWGSFFSSTGGLLGSLLSYNPAAGLQFFQAGTPNDLDGDRDLDVGGYSVDNAGGHVAYLTGPSPISVPTGTVLLGQLQFTAEQLTGSTDINWVYRNRTTASNPNSLLLHTLRSDGIFYRMTGADPRLAIGTPVTVSYAPPSDTENYDEWIINSSVSRTGGTAIANRIYIGTTGTGALTQSAGLIRSSLLFVGERAGMTGTLTQTGGEMQFTAASIGFSGNGSVAHSSGRATYGSLTVSQRAGSTGTMTISGDADVAVSGSAVIGQSAPATYVQTGGTAGFSAGVNFNNASASISGGFLNTTSITLSSPSTITQSGGAVSTSALIMPAAAPSATAVYELQAGTLSAEQLAPGATFRQTGGMINFVRIQSNAGATHNARVEVAGGAMSASIVRLGATSTAATHTELLDQTGGAISAMTFDVTKSGRYEMAGGSLNVGDRLSNAGVVDLSDAAVTLNFADGAFIDFSKYWGPIGTRSTGGQLLNAGNATIVAGANSFMNFPAGFDLNSIGSIASDGIIHIDREPVTISNGKMLGGTGGLTGDLVNQGVVSPGNSPGSWQIEGDYDQQSGGTLMMEIAGAGSASFDMLSVTGLASLDGTLQVALLGGFIPASTDEFTILTAGSLQGFFANAPLMITLAEGTFAVEYSTTGVMLTNFAAVPEPGSVSALLAGGAVMLRRRRDV
jgi:hypothetical protein